MPSPLDDAALEMIRSALKPVAGVASEPPVMTGCPIPDAEIQLPDGRRVAIELKRWGGSSRNGRLSGAVVVWILERSAPELRRRLREADENFVDLRGRVRLHLPGLLVDRTDLAAVRRKQNADTRNPFADRASRIPRTFFAAPRDRQWTIQELSKSAGVSMGTTSYVVSALSERDLVEVVPAGREKRVRLADPRSLVLQWTAEYTWRRNKTVAFEAPMGSPSRFLRRLPEQLEGVRWALGLQAGASLVLPHARWDTVHVYVKDCTPEKLRKIGSRAGWKPSESGKVVLLAPHYTDSVWYGAREIEGLAAVSDLQLILDLWHYPVRGREQAEMLLEQVVPAQQ
jgi:hypothetical protein